MDLLRLVLDLRTCAVCHTLLLSSRGCFWMEVDQYSTTLAAEEPDKLAADVSELREDAWRLDLYSELERMKQGLVAASQSSKDGPTAVADSADAGARSTQSGADGFEGAVAGGSAAEQQHIAASNEDRGQAAVIATSQDDAKAYTLTDLVASAEGDATEDIYNMARQVQVRICLFKRLLGSCCALCVLH